MNLSEFEPTLEKAIGLDLSTLGETIVRKAVERRIAATVSSNETAYLDLVRGSPAELQALVEELVVNESWFLRHPQAFTVLSRQAQSFLGSRHQGLFRVLSLPCAFGEEPYTIAITLLEAGLPPSRFAIDAADISLRALERARAGVYGPRTMRAVNESLRLRYFRLTAPNVWTVQNSLRASLRFLTANILNLKASGLVGPYQAIFCRNLLIYQSDGARKKILVGLRDALLPEGLLFVGHAESLAILDRDFVRLDDRGAFAYRRRTAAIRPTSSAQPTRPIHPAVEARLGSPATVPRPSGNPHPLAPPVLGPTADSLHAAALELANQRRYDDAAQICEASLRRFGPSSAAYHALGVIRAAAGQHEPARLALERAIYLDPGHEDALLALALLARRTGDSDSATRYEQRAHRAHLRRSRPT